MPGTKLVKLPKSGAVWGGVTGNIDLQLDLKAKLDSKVNIAGGTLTGPVCIPISVNQNISNVRNAGFLFGASAATAQAGIAAFNGTLFFHSQSSNDSSIFPMQLNTSELGLAPSVWLAWASVNASSTKDLFLGRVGPATLQIGKDHATAPINQKIKGPNSTVSGTGGDVWVCGGSGVSADGYVRLGTASGGIAFFGYGGSTIISSDTQSDGADPVNQNTEFTGGVAGGSYTIGGLIKSLKSYGLIG